VSTQHKNSVEIRNMWTFQ